MSKSEEPDKSTSSLIAAWPGAFLIRLIMVVPVIATQFVALGLVVYGTWETIEIAIDLITRLPAISHDVLLIRAIEVVDLFLLATVMQVVSLGLYQLYFKQDLQLPKWLKIETLDDLKSKLVGVTITVMAVFVLGRVLAWEGEQSIVYLGLGSAAVIIALTYFLSKIDHGHDK